MNSETAVSSEGFGNRRNARGPANFAVEIEGLTPQGETFRADAMTEVVSCSGATLITDINVERGTALRLKAPFRVVFEAEVNGIWTHPADGRQRVGVKLIRPATWLSD